jgi:hypothetical protein
MLVEMVDAAFWAAENIVWKKPPPVGDVGPLDTCPSETPSFAGGVEGGAMLCDSLLGVLLAEFALLLPPLDSLTTAPTGLFAGNCSTKSLVGVGGVMVVFGATERELADAVGLLVTTVGIFPLADVFWPTFCREGARGGTGGISLPSVVFRPVRRPRSCDGREVSPPEVAGRASGISLEYWFSLLSLLFI